MVEALRKHVFHEVKVAGIAFRATLRDGRVLLRVERPDGRETYMYLARGSERPSLCYAEAWKDRNRRADLGPGWMLCNYDPTEPVIHLGQLSDDDVALLVREFGIHRDFGDDVDFSDSAAARSLKRIVAEEPERAVLFRKKAKVARWLAEHERSVEDAPDSNVRILDE